MMTAQHSQSANPSAAPSAAAAGVDKAQLRRLTALAALVAPERPIEIVDVGANPLNAPDYAGLVAVGAARVTGFEPQASAFEALAPMQSEQMRFFPHAVGDGGKHQLNICNGSGFTSLLTPNARAIDFLGRFKWKATVTEQTPVATKRLDDIDEITQIDFLKIDIQGGELAVFENARTALAGCLAVMTEVAFIPLYEDQPLLDAQMQELRGQGFDLHKFMFAKAVPLGSPLKAKGGLGRNQLVDGDAVFLRGLLDLADAPDLHLKHLALLADGCFGSFDLAVRCLSYLEARGALNGRSSDPYLKLLSKTTG
jgi:FkbM family methyltransferase